MAPSATDVIVPVLDNIKDKLDQVIQATASKPDETQKASESSKTDERKGTNTYVKGHPDSTPALETGHRENMLPTGALDKFQHFDVTPVIGREFIGVDLAEWLHAPNSDELLRELAITSKPDI